MQVARLRAHLEQIKRDDRMIKSEGLDSLSEEELRQVRTRGVPPCKNGKRVLHASMFG